MMSNSMLIAWSQRFISGLANGSRNASLSSCSKRCALLGCLGRSAKSIRNSRLARCSSTMAEMRNASRMDSISPMPTVIRMTVSLSRLHSVRVTLTRHDSSFSADACSSASIHMRNASDMRERTALHVPFDRRSCSNWLMVSFISVPVMRTVLSTVIVLSSLAWLIGFSARRLYGTMSDALRRCTVFRGLWSEDGSFGVSHNGFGTATIAIIELWSCRTPVDNCWYD